MSAVSSGQNQSGNAGSLETPGKPSLQSNIASNLQVVADRSSALTDQLSELTSFVWSWLRQRSADSDFERLIGKIFFSLDSDDAFTVEQQSSVDQLQHDLASGSGLSPLDFQLIPRSSMPGLVGAYASQHPSGAPTVLINETWFDQATDQERVITLLQEIGHAVDDQLNGESWDTTGDEGAFFAASLTVVDPDAVDASWFSYDDHHTLILNGQAVSVEASGGADDFFRSTPDGRDIPSSASKVGGIVLQLVGTNGATLFTQTKATSLYKGFFDSSPGVVGSQSSLDLSNLGGGLSRVSMRWTINDGDTAGNPSDTNSQEFDYDDITLGMNGVSLQSASGLTAYSHDDSGNNATVVSGFPNNVTATGWVTTTDSTKLSTIYNSITQNSNTATFHLFDSDVNDNYFDFTKGIDSSMSETESAPNTALELYSLDWRCGR